MFEPQDLVKQLFIKQIRIFSNYAIFKVIVAIFCVIAAIKATSLTFPRLWTSTAGAIKLFGFDFDFEFDNFDFGQNMNDISAEKDHLWNSVSASFQAWLQKVFLSHVVWACVEIIQCSILL